MSVSSDTQKVMVSVKQSLHVLHTQSCALISPSDRENACSSVVRSSVISHAHFHQELLNVVEQMQQVRSFLHLLILL